MKIVGNSKEVLGTHVSVSIVDDSEMKAERLVKAAFAEFERIEETYSRFIEGNELWRINSHLNEWLPVKNELFDLLSFSEDLRRKTGGAFDVTIASILEGWGYDKAYSFEEKNLGRLGEVELLDGKIRVSSKIDLGALGKGFAIDKAKGILEEAENFCIDAGGDIYAQGRDGKNDRWRALFEHPLDEKKAIGHCDVDGIYLACSNGSKRKWRNKHHIVDPRRSCTANNMLAVYTQAKSGVLADAYATALFVLGFDIAREMLSDFPIEAMLINTNGDIFRTDGFAGELYLA